MPTCKYCESRGAKHKHYCANLRRQVRVSHTEAVFDAIKRHRHDPKAIGDIHDVLMHLAGIVSDIEHEFDA